MILEFKIPGDPIAKARLKAAAIGGRVRVYTPTRSKDYEYLVKLAAQQAMKGEPPVDCPLSIVVGFHLSAPSSWSEKKQREAWSGAIRPTGKPDLDNLLKSTLDGMLSVVYIDDACVCSVLMSKMYSAIPQTVVRVVDIAAKPSRRTTARKEAEPWPWSETMTAESAPF